MYSYAAMEDGILVWKEGCERIVNHYVAEDHRCYVVDDGMECPLAFVHIGADTECKDLVYRKDDHRILQSPVEALVGQTWRGCVHDDGIWIEVLQGMIQYPNGHPRFLDNGSTTIWILNGWPVWIFSYFSKGGFFAKDWVPTDGRDMGIFLTMHMHEDQIMTMTSLPRMGENKVHLCPSPISWDDEEVHALRFKKGSPYILQGNDMDTRVLKMISMPGYPGIVMGKMPIVMDINDDGVWRTSIPIMDPLGMDAMYKSKDACPGSGEDHTYISIMDAYIPNRTEIHPK